jgi:hypothetical protein
MFDFFDLYSVEVKSVEELSQQEVVEKNVKAN